jgi:hypothetical protein
MGIDRDYELSLDSPRRFRQGAAIGHNGTLNGRRSPVGAEENEKYRRESTDLATPRRSATANPPRCGDFLCRLRGLLPTDADTTLWRRRMRTARDSRRMVAFGRASCGGRTAVRSAAVRVVRFGAANLQTLRPASNGLSRIRTWWVRVFCGSKTGPLPRISEPVARVNVDRLQSLRPSGPSIVRAEPIDPGDRRKESRAAR